MSKTETKMEINKQVKWTFFVVVIVIILLLAGPYYTVWSKGMNGRAILQEAEYSRKVRVAEAQAKLDSAKLEAQAEIQRASGQAQANEVITKTLSPEVLQYQYIRMLEENGDANNEKTIIYIPVNPSTGLPVSLPNTEATRLSK